MTISGDAVTGVSASATAGGADEMFFSQANAKVPGAILANGGVSGVVVYRVRQSPAMP